jgi:hypothetical protein
MSSVVMREVIARIGEDGELDGEKIHRRIRR